jgi:hypothetical protein
MEHSDSESEFELQEVDPGLAGFYDELSETSSEEPDIGEGVSDRNDGDNGNDTDAADTHDADAVPPADAQTDDKGIVKKRKHFQDDAWMDTTGMVTVHVPLWQKSVEHHPHKKVFLAGALGANLKKKAGTGNVPCSQHMGLSHSSRHHFLSAISGCLFLCC